MTRTAKRPAVEACRGCGADVPADELHPDLRTCVECPIPADDEAAVKAAFARLLLHVGRP